MWVESDDELNACQLHSSQEDESYRVTEATQIQSDRTGLQVLKCSIQYPSDTVSVGKLASRSVIVVSESVKLKYIGPISISSLTPLRGFTNLDTKLTFTGSNLMLLQDYTEIFCQIGSSTKFEATIID